MSEGLEILPLAGGLGAEVRDVRLGSTIGADGRSVRAAWLEHLVLSLPDPRLSLSRARRVPLCRRLGEIEIHPFIPKVSGRFPEIVVLDGDEGVRPSPAMSTKGIAADPRTNSIAKPA